MRISLLIAAPLLLAATGCVLRYAYSDSDAARYVMMREIARPQQRPVVVHFRTEGESERDRARIEQAAAMIFFGSGKFRMATAADRPVFDIRLSVRSYRKTYTIAAILGAFNLYVWPVGARDRICEVFAEIRGPDGKLIETCFAQSCATATLWLGHLFRLKWPWDPGTSDFVYRDALKAITVKISRAVTSRMKK